MAGSKDLWTGLVVNTVVPGGVAVMRYMADGLLREEAKPLVTGIAVGFAAGFVLGYLLCLFLGEFGKLTDYWAARVARRREIDRYNEEKKEKRLLDEAQEYAITHGWIRVDSYCWQDADGRTVCRKCFEERPKPPVPYFTRENGRTFCRRCGLCYDMVVHDLFK